MSEKELYTLVQAVEDSELGTMKVLLSGLVRLVNDPMASIKDLHEVIELDPPLAGKILKVANSAYYASHRRFDDIEQAVIWIGLEAVKEIALSQSACEIFATDNGSDNGFSRIALWRHSLSVAILSKLIARREFGEPGGDAFTSGLLHDIGLIFEDQHLHHKFEEVLERLEYNGHDIVTAEKEVFGFDHAGVGMVVANRWDFPSDLSYALAFHHDLRAAPPDRAKLATIVFLSDNVSHYIDLGIYELEEEKAESNIDDALEKIGMERHSLDLLVEDMKVEFEQMTNLFIPY